MRGEWGVWMAVSGSAVPPRARGATDGRQRDLTASASAVFAAAAMLAIAVPALMSTPDDVGRSARSVSHVAGLSSSPPETLVAAYGGVTHTHASDVKFEKPGQTNLTAKDVEWIGRPFKSPIYYGLRAMRWPEASRFGGMLDFTHAKAISVREQSVTFQGTRDGRPADRTAKIGDTFRHLEFSHGHNMLTVNGLARLGSITPWLMPYVGAGAGVSLPHTEVQFLDEPRRTYEYQITGAVGQAVAGIEIRLPRVSILVEYKFSLAPYWVPLSGRDGSKGNAFLDYWVQLRRLFTGEAPQDGTLTTNLFSHHLIVGVGYRHEGAAAASAR